MIRIVSEASDIEYRSAMRRSKDLPEAIAQLTALRNKEDKEDKNVRDALDHILNGVETIRRVDMLRDNFNEQDLCFAIDTLCTSLTRLDANHDNYGVGQEGTAPIPLWKCKEWKCLYENADKRERVETILQKIYKGGATLNAAIHNGGSGKESISNVESDIARAIIGDKTSKNDKPFGARGKYETYVQFITSILPFDNEGDHTFSKIPSPNEQAKKKTEEMTESTLLEGMSSLISLDSGSSKGRSGQAYAVFALDRATGCTCTYLNNDEVLVVFDNTNVHVIKDLNTLYQLIKPTLGDWDTLRVRDKGTGGSFIVECQLRENIDTKICKRIQQHVENKQKQLVDGNPNTNPSDVSNHIKPTNKSRSSSPRPEPPPDVETAEGIKVEVKNASNKSKFCIKFSLPKNTHIEKEDWTDYAEWADEAYEVLE